MPGTEIRRPTAHRPGLEFVAAWKAEVGAWVLKRELELELQALEALEDETLEALEPAWGEFALLEAKVGRAQALAEEQWARWRQHCAAQDQVQRERHASSLALWGRLWAAAHPDPVAVPQPEQAAGATEQP